MDAAKPVERSAAQQLRRAGTGIALALVAGLIALLVYRIATQESAQGFVDQVAAGRRPAAPGFDLRRLDDPGSRVSLSAFLGRPVVINWWASWCDPCKREAPLLEAAHRRWRERGVAFVGVDANDFTSDGRRFVERHGLTFTMLEDGSGSTLRRWGITGFPETFFVDGEGRVVAHAAGELDSEELEGGIRKALG